MHTQALVVEEIQRVLGDTPPSQWSAEQLKGMPWLNACINESMRVWPAAGGMYEWGTVLL